MMMSKINFKKLKNIFLNDKYFKKQSQPQYKKFLRGLKS